MICIILVASVETELERALLAKPEFAHLANIPKALLPLAGKSMLDLWWECVRARRDITKVGTRHSSASRRVLFLRD